MDKLPPWTLECAPDQAGRVALITGANSGLGLETARMLAALGAHVVLACRNQTAGALAIQQIQERHPAASLSLLSLDLADLNSVQAAAEEALLRHEQLDILVNNAGVMAPPFSRTRQGFELQFGTNHLGHFALAGRLLPLLLKTTQSRVVVVSSAAANFGRIDFNDLNFEQRSYAKWTAYNQSKLATLLFAVELSRRLSAAGCSSLATAAHPGGTATNLQRNAWFFRTIVNRYLAAPVNEGALSILRAATDQTIESGSYWGPSKYFEMRGPPEKAAQPRVAKDPALARRLWIASENLTGVRFSFDQASG